MAAIDDFMKALSTDSALKDKISAAPDAATAEKIARAAGFPVTDAEIIAFYKSKMGELSEEQLGAIAGGKGKSGKGSKNTNVGNA